MAQVPSWVLAEIGEGTRQTTNFIHQLRLLVAAHHPTAHAPRPLLQYYRTLRTRQYTQRGAAEDPCPPGLQGAPDAPAAALRAPQGVPGWASPPDLPGLMGEEEEGLEPGYGVEPSDPMDEGASDEEGSEEGSEQGSEEPPAASWGAPVMAEGGGGAGGPYSRWHPRRPLAQRLRQPYTVSRGGEGGAARRGGAGAGRAAGGDSDLARAAEAAAAEAVEAAAAAVEAAVPAPVFERPSPCSFLVPGTVFEGVQRLTQPSLASAGAQGSDGWRVLVRIQEVDTQSGSLRGTMDAYNVPGAASPVTTFWEGEIVDDAAHTFYTRQWGAGRDTDLRHWAKFEGFGCIRAQVVRHNGRCGSLATHPWVYMRWKEACFVGAAADCGLTIAGFYYLCLERSSGRLRGLYHDPSSAPFQELDLAARRMPGGAGLGFGAYSLR